MAQNYFNSWVLPSSNVFLIFIPTTRPLPAYHYKIMAHPLWQTAQKAIKPSLKNVHVLNL